jgi:hypothetical protein
MYSNSQEKAWCLLIAQRQHEERCENDSSRPSWDKLKKKERDYWISWVMESGENLLWHLAKLEYLHSKKPLPDWDELEHHERALYVELYKASLDFHRTEGSAVLG